MASPHLRPEFLAPVAYNNAGQADRAPGAPVNENWKPQEGQIVEGKFRLVQKLGESDHSVVFLTERSEEPQKAVIKLTPATNTEDQILRWKLSAKLPHPHLLRIFESGQCDLNGNQLLYVVMEFAEEDLSQVLPHRPLTSAEARQMALPLLDVLNYLHGKGFIHGRITPGNILAIADQVKLSSDSISAISEGVGTPGINDPPEAKIGKVSPATDVWSLGMTLAEVLTLQKPSWDAIKRQEPVLPKGLDESFSIIIRNCLKLDAASRWTISEIKSLLQPDKIPAAKVTRGSKSKVFYYVVPILVLLFFGVLISSIKHREPQGSVVAVSNSNPSNQEVKDSNPSAQNAKPVPATPAPHVATKAKAPIAQTSGGVVQQVLPEVAASARRTITGRIRVKVKVSVGSDVNVTNTTLDSPSKSNYFNRLSQEAAGKWKFSPASREWIIHFVFTSSNTTAKAEQLK